MLGNIGLSGLILILVVLLIFFGPSKLPEIGKAFGKGLREFKNATNGMMDDTPVSKADSNQSNVHAAAPVVEPIPIKTDEELKLNQ